MKAEIKNLKTGVVIADEKDTISFITKYGVEFNIKMYGDFIQINKIGGIYSDKISIIPQANNSIELK